MYLDLFNNAVDSIQQAKYFYKQYLDNENKYSKQAYSSLKLAIICLQISIEVFMKKILSEVNELLIFDDENITKITKEVGLQIKNKNKYSLNDLIIRRGIDVKTISYSKCIERGNQIFSDIKNEHVEDLKNLGHLRNQIVHFGIDREIEYYKILIIMNRAFKFFDEFIYPRYIDEFSNLNLEIYELIANGEFCEKEARSVFYEYPLEELDKFVDSLYLMFKEKLLANGINIEIFKEYNDIELYTISDIGFFDIEEEYVYLGVSIKTVIELDATYLFINEIKNTNEHELSGSVFAVIDHSKSGDAIYVYKSMDLLKSEENKIRNIINSSPENKSFKNSKEWLLLDFNKIMNMDFESIINGIKKNKGFNKHEKFENVIDGYWKRFKNLFNEDWNDLNKNRK